MSRTVGPICRKAEPASNRVMLVPPAPKSHSATTPSAGSPGWARSAVSAATASETSAGGTPRRARSGWAKNSSLRAVARASDQYAGIAIVTGVP
ncbi:hypothetical protein BN971_04009 [Mycobacterium bohemicum DSM 44277]|uniref:Uncharacterized protein n=1 Tax=Mycobacterium bohemicum DSM 44277 TaxID=1236609 RepID=A0A0U0WCN0_MYCBE|nr:hypothetical protein BN971_04009 [Mycobacterium bohemicum DSM 44277]